MLVRLHTQQPGQVPLLLWPLIMGLCLKQTAVWQVAWQLLQLVALVANKSIVSCERMMLLCPLAGRQTSQQALM